MHRENPSRSQRETKVKMAATFRVEQLTGDNYDTWKIHMRAILKRNKLWGYVTGEIPRPSATGDTLEEWKMLDGQAESDILLAVSPSELTELDNLNSSKEIWDKLKSLYQSSGTVRKATLLKKLALTRMQEGDDIKKHLAEYFEADKKLKEIGLVVPDELLAILLLYSLPDSFEMFRTAMETRDDLPPTDVLKVKILEDYEGRKSRNQGTEQGAMYVHRNKRYPGPQKKVDEKSRERDGARNKNPIECYRCNRLGHIAKDCRSKFVSKNRQSARQLEEKDTEADNAPSKDNKTR